MVLSSGEERRCRTDERDSSGATGGRIDGIPAAGCKAAHFDREEIPDMATGRT